MIVHSSEFEDEPRCQYCGNPISETAYAKGLKQCLDCLKWKDFSTMKPSRPIRRRLRRISQPDPSPWQENAIRDLEEARAGWWYDEM